MRCVAFLLSLSAAAASSAADAPVFPKFRDEVIDPAVGVGYALSLADVDGDGKTDIVVVTEQPDQVVWYQNPTWKKRTILEKFPKLPVCIQPLQINGKTHFALGADWQPSNTSAGGTVWLVRPPEDLEKRWTAYLIDEEPSMHRMRVIEIDGRPELVCSTLQGRGTKAPDWLGDGASLYVLKRPPNPYTGKWVREVITQDLHAKHNVWPTDLDGSGKPQILAAAFEGLFVYTRTGDDGKWVGRKIGEGDQSEKSRPKRGTSEVKIGRLPGGKRYIAAVEPWHGDKAVMYVEPARPDEMWRREVLLENHKGGHAVWTADLTGTGADSAVIGFRGPPEGKPGEWVVYVFHPADATGTKWEKMVLDPKGMGSEDVACADLNGDGRIDVVALGRGTKNVKVYWNEGK
jgi:hypothetical protein